MSPETDILVVGDPSERFSTEIRLAFRHWQVYDCNWPGRLNGRRFRRAYFTEGAMQHRNWRNVIDLLDQAAILQGGEVIHFAEYMAPVSVDPQDWVDAALASDIRRGRYAQPFT